jgi:hypothetical protein
MLQVLGIEPFTFTITKLINGLCTIKMYPVLVFLLLFHMFISYHFKTTR